MLYRFQEKLAVYSTLLNEFSPSEIQNSDYKVYNMVFENIDKQPTPCLHHITLSHHATDYFLRLSSYDELEKCQSKRGKTWTKIFKF